MASTPNNTPSAFRPPETKADLEQFWSERGGKLAAVLKTDKQEQE